MSNFSSFPHYFIYIFLTSGVKLHIHLLNVVVRFIVFLTLSTLICRGTDISKYFSESLGIRDDESRLYTAVYEETIKLSLRFSFLCVFFVSKGNILYSRLSLSRIPRDSLKYFEISIVRHIRFAELRQKII